MAMDLDEPLGAEKGEVALQRLRDADRALYLSPSADLAAAARAASKHLHFSLALFSPTQPPPLPNLLAGPAFDAEQIWSQIELISRPILPHLRRQLRRLERQPPSQPATPPPSKPADAQEEESDDEEDGEGDELEEELGRAANGGRSTDAGRAAGFRRARGQRQTLDFCEISTPVLVA